ncbi:MAG: mechanosensitive ion channel family protein [Phycisphaerae bacterium]
MNTVLDFLKTSFEGYGTKIVVGVATLLVGWLLARMLTFGLRRILNRTGVDGTLVLFFTNLAYITMLAFAVITALQRFGFPAVSFAAVVGAASLAIGLALKGTLSNLAAGVLLIALRPFNVGDRIEVGGTIGEVVRIAVFATTLRAADEKTVIIPNAAITGGTITRHP